MDKLAKYALSLLLIINLAVRANSDENGVFRVGVGIGDVTGPSADIGMMGYAALDQSARGIHTRLFSRAFIFESDGVMVVYASVDLGMVDQAIKTKVVEVLQTKFGPDLFTSQNVLLSGTHTHSGPAGYIQYLLYGITSLGFHKENFEAIVDGIVSSIERAHADLQPGKIFINKGELMEANINRSPTSYLANPLEEREMYNDNVDKEMVLLRIESEDGRPLGAVNWFPVHPTSMNNTNKLISGDNKGYAAMQFEYKMNPNSRPGKGKFVAAFGSANLGDVSPNIMGAKCINTGLPCHEDSTCGPNHFSKYCIAFGPGKFGDNEESTEIIGDRQFKKAEQLFEDKVNAKQLVGPIQFKHQFVNMTLYEVELTNSTTGEKYKRKLCKGALGYSFAAGTTDGPGAFDFKQGTTSGNAFWDFIKDNLINATDELVACHEPKPILLAVGEAFWPYDWSPSIVETQILRIGNLYVIGIPGELTTMAGRRLKGVVEAAVKAQLPENAPEIHVVVAGLSNVYTHYITTFEEYQKQRYEAASTLFGPHTLDGYLQQYPILVNALLNNITIEVGPKPQNLLDRQISLITPIIVDTVPFLYDFGDVMNPPEPTAIRGNTVSTTFVAGHPRNNPMREGTFFLIERKIEDSSRWEIVRTDADWDTKFRWSRPIFLSGLSEVEITWKISENATPGFYRIRHFGYYKPAMLKAARPYQGSTSIFQVLASKDAQPKKHPLWDPNPQRKKTIRSVQQFWSALVARQTAPFYKEKFGNKVHPSMPQFSS